MWHALVSVFPFLRGPKRLLLPAPATMTISPLSPDDVETLWDLLVPGSKDHLTREYTRVSYDGACERLDQAIYALQQQGATVRQAFLCEDDDSHEQGFPALSIGLLKLYSELPRSARASRYAPVQRFHKDEKGWLWLALLLAEPKPQRTEPIVTPAPSVVRVTTPPQTLARAPQQDVLLTSLIEMNVPPQQSYPAPTPASDLPPLREDSPAITHPLPAPAAQEPEPEVEEADDQAAHFVAELCEDVTAMINRKTASKTAPVAAPVPADDILSDWLDLDEPKAPRIKLSALLESDNIAFIGPKGSGKTTGLLTAVKHRKGEVIALDPHATPNKWPCRTVGNGRNYGVIRRAFNALQAKMAERFGEIGNGTRGERYYLRPDRRRTICCDEFRSIGKNVPPIKAVRERGVEIEPAELGAGEHLLERISEGRKVGETVLIACHNDTNEALALPTGAADMKSCFDYFVYCGGMALERYERRAKAKHAALDELRAMRHPAVVWHTERNTWALLDFDLDPVLPPDDEEKDDEETDTLLLDETPVQTSPQTQLPTEELIRKVAALKGISLPVPLDRVSDPELLPILKIAVGRGLKTLPISRIIFDAERNSRFRTDKLDPVLEQLRCENG